MDHIQKMTIDLMCDADKRDNMLRFLGEDDMQLLSPTIEDFQKYYEEEN